jgi:hypothetical protein
MKPTLTQLLKEYFELIEFPLPLTADEKNRVNELKELIKNYIKNE